MNRVFKSRYGLFTFCFILLLINSGCWGPSGRGSAEDLEAWDATSEYDPVTGKRYHNRPPAPSARDTQYDYGGGYAD